MHPRCRPSAVSNPVPIYPSKTYGSAESQVHHFNEAVTGVGNTKDSDYDFRVYNASARLDSDSGSYPSDFDYLPESVPVLSPKPIRLGDNIGLQTLASFDPNIEIVFTDDFADVELEVVLEVLMDPPKPSPGKKARILIPKARFTEILKVLRTVLHNSHPSTSS